jgi:hypothetical protein
LSLLSLLPLLLLLPLPRLLLVLRSGPRHHQ